MHGNVFSSSPAAICTHGSVRLVDDMGRSTEGRVEYCNNGEWGTVCHYGWSVQNAVVVCRQLGHNTFGGYFSILHGHLNYRHD